ncbi:MAG: hydroxypyruvate isomerase family protein [Hyphomicrobiaceae bacterium]|nr:MAG: hydroxypyruvate isomerase family protein [Hyphomicrobiaceae bacterium]
MPRFAANLSMMFNEVPFLDRFKAAADAGFKGVEFLFPYEHPKEEMKRRLDEHGLEIALFNMPPGDFEKGERGLAALKGREEEFERGIHRALDYAKTLGCLRVHAMAGLRQGGADRATYINNLAKAARAFAPHAIDVLIEPINPRDIPGYFLNRTAEAKSIIDAVGASNLKLQLDLYHRQIVEGDLVQAITEYADVTAHIQIASPPDRGEPDDGEINYLFIFQTLDKMGYKGWVGCEYRPRRGTREGLVWLSKLSSSHY